MHLRRLKKWQQFRGIATHNGRQASEFALDVLHKRAMPANEHDEQHLFIGEIS